MAVVVLCQGGVHHKVEKMYMTRTMRSDLAPEASGYIYRSDSNGPSSYIHLGPGAINQHLNTYPQQAAPLVHPQTFASYGYAPVQPKYEDAGKAYIAPIVASYAPHAYAPAPVVQDVQQYDESGDDEDESDDEEGEEEQYVQQAPVSAHHGFINGGGKANNAQSHSAHGAKGDKGYKSVSSFNHGLEGQHHKDGHKGYYNDASGHKSGHSDGAKHYAENHEAAQGHKGGSFSENKGHKKGHKTTGFHNVYHKDEYKKEHKFYDDAHNNGHFDKNGAFDANHHSAQGGHAQGAKHDSAYHNDSFGKKGFSDKGQVSESEKGNANKAGEEGYYNNYKDYANKGGSAHGKEYGYADKH